MSAINTDGSPKYWTFGEVAGDQQKAATNIPNDAKYWSSGEIIQTVFVVSNNTWNTFLMFE